MHQAGELAAGPDRAGEFGSTEAQPGCCVAFQGAQAKFGQLEGMADSGQTRGHVWTTNRAVSEVW